MRQKLHCIILLICFLFTFSFNSFAYKMGNGLVLLVDSNSLPPSVAYIDLLVPLDKSMVEDTQNYKIITINGDTIELSDNSQLVNYDDGFISYSVYVSDDIVSIKQDDSILIEFGADRESIKNTYNSIKIGTFDYKGNVINISNPIKLKNYGPFELNTLSLVDGNLSVNYHFNPYYGVGILVLFVGIIFLIVILLKRKRTINREGVKS